MNQVASRPTPAWTVFRLLWTAARRRAAARNDRQSEIMGRRKKSGMATTSTLVRLLPVILVCAMHALLAFWMIRVVENAPAQSPPDGRLAVSEQDWHSAQAAAWHHEAVLARKKEFAQLSKPTFQDRQRIVSAERERDRAIDQLARVVRKATHGRTTAVPPEHRTMVQRQVYERGIEGFTPVYNSFERRLADPNLKVLPMVALVLVAWFGIMICQGEGLELDVQKRRHPMWEWLLSHPVKPAHAFYAELLAPLMANPIYLACPVFLWVLLARIHAPGTAILAGVLIGVPVAVVTSALYKAIETAAMLRLNTRSRGGVLGVLSWIGYIGMFMPFVLRGTTQLGPVNGWFEAASPWFPNGTVRALLVGWNTGSASIVEVVLSWWAVLLALGAVALWITHQATGVGLQAPTCEVDTSSTKGLLATGRRLGANPLRRKELLWLMRDRSAIVQVILIPLTMASIQVLYFRGIYEHAEANWRTVSALAMIGGSYFLLVLGPRSLASEGSALWMALTWPRGLEDLLKEKAKLWRVIADTIVFGVLTVACFIFPADWWRIGLVAAGWAVLGRSLSLNTVSLVTAPSSSGEPEPANRAAQWLAMFAPLTFCTGVLTGNWHTAFAGIVFSALVAYVMWQQLKARLAFLFDPWSIEPVKAPTILHATLGVVGLSCLIVMGSAVVAAYAGSEGLALARSLGYGLGGALALMIMSVFLREHGVGFADIMRWPGASPRHSLGAGVALGLSGGVALALAAMGYLQLVQLIPAGREALDEMARDIARWEQHVWWFALLAVVFAPVAEEYFFRGLLFRALNRELGDWRAIALSTGVFAVVHPPLSWVPVACVGLAAAWLFKNTRHLVPCVMLHFAYNGTLTLFSALGT